MYADRSALAGTPVPAGQPALLGARLLPAQTQDRMRLCTPRWTRRSKHISSRSLSLLLKMPACTHYRHALARRPPHGTQVYGYPLWWLAGTYVASQTHENVIGSRKMKKSFGPLRQSASLPGRPCKGEEIL